MYLYIIYQSAEESIKVISNMKKIFLAFFMVTFMSFSASSQSMEVGAQIGAMVYTGDLDPPTFSQNFKNTRTALGLHFKYKLNPLFNIRFNFTKGSVTGKDSLSDKSWQLERNLSFETGITEFAVMIENNMLGFSMDKNDEKTFSPYAFAGIAVYRFNPRTLYQGVYYDLQPLGTEGQGLPGYEEKYSLTQIAVPLGGGLKIRLSDKLSMGLEVNSRFLFTDYLDDLSGTYVAYEELMAGNGEIAARLANREHEFTGIDVPYTNETGSIRGKAAVNDYYMTAMFSLSYHFTGTGMRFGRSRGMGCPTF